MLDRRRDQVGLLRQRRNDMDRAEQDHSSKTQARDERSDEAKAAAARREAADSMVEQQGRALLDAWQDHFDNLRQLSVPDVQASLDALAAWMPTLQGENPARAVLQAAQQRTAERLAKLQAELAAEQHALQAEKAGLEAERDRLEQGEEGAPAASPFRAPNARIGRAGAPLWQLVDFHDEVSEGQRAGLEAALEASGLLDAWVTPDGRLETADGTQLLQDTQVVQRPHRGATLAAWLQPSGSVVAAETIASLLRGIACTTADDGGDETWLSPDGRFRIGALAGAWAKPVASYIGYAARAAARARRLDAIALELERLTEALARLEDRFAEYARHQEQAAAEWQGAPVDDLLRAAHAEAASCSREFQAASVRLEQAEQQLNTANQILQTARSALTRDAQDLHLPDSHQGLNLVEQALTRLSEATFGLVHAVSDLRQAHAELERQRLREQEARLDADRSAKNAADRRDQAEEARVRLETLRESVGPKVGELQQRLEEAHACGQSR